LLFEKDNQEAQIIERQSVISNGGFGYLADPQLPGCVEEAYSWKS
jgi:hypothetical protein